MDYIREFDIRLEKEMYYAGELLQGQVILNTVENFKLRGEHWARPGGGSGGRGDEVRCAMALLPLVLLLGSGITNKSTPSASRKQ